MEASFQLLFCPPFYFWFNQIILITDCLFVKISHIFNNNPLTTLLPSDPGAETFSVGPSLLSHCLCSHTYAQLLHKSLSSPTHFPSVLPPWLGVDKWLSMWSCNSISHKYPLLIFKVQHTCFLQPEKFTGTFKQKTFLPSHSCLILWATQMPYIRCRFTTQWLTWLCFILHWIPCSLREVFLHYPHMHFADGDQSEHFFT